MNNSVFNVSRASDFGLMKIDDTGRVISFSEKPKGADLKVMVSRIDFFMVHAIQLTFLHIRMKL